MGGDAPFGLPTLAFLEPPFSNNTASIACQALLHLYLPPQPPKLPGLHTPDLPQPTVATGVHSVRHHSRAFDDADDDLHHDATSHC